MDSEEVESAFSHLNQILVPSTIFKFFDVSGGGGDFLRIDAVLLSEFGPFLRV